MIELVILAILVVLVVAGMHYGRPAAPVIIARPGQYHITLAPQLHQTRIFIEDIAARFTDPNNRTGDTPTLYFEVHLREMAEQGDTCLLAVALRGGMLYFQGINPRASSRDGRLRELREFSGAVLLHHPLLGTVVMQTVESLQRAVEDAARQAGITLHPLQ